MKSQKEKGKTIKLELYRSAAGRTKQVKAVLATLGLSKIGDTKEYPSNPSVLGTLRRVEHIVRVVK